MRCAKGKHYYYYYYHYYVMGEHVHIFTSFTAVYSATAGEEPLKW
jgi:hypothetical protein